MRFHIISPSVYRGNTKKCAPFLIWHPDEIFSTIIACWDISRCEQNFILRNEKWWNMKNSYNNNVSFFCTENTFGSIFTIVYACEPVLPSGEVKFEEIRNLHIHQYSLFAHGTHRPLPLIPFPFDLLHPFTYFFASQHLQRSDFRVVWKPRWYDNVFVSHVKQSQRAGGLMRRCCRSGALPSGGTAKRR